MYLNLIPLFVTWKTAGSKVMSYVIVTEPQGVTFRHMPHVVRNFDQRMALGRREICRLLADPFYRIDRDRAMIELHKPVFLSFNQVWNIPFGFSPVMPAQAHIR